MKLPTFNKYTREHTLVFRSCKEHAGRGCRSCTFWLCRYLILMHEIWWIGAAPGRASARDMVAGAAGTWGEWLGEPLGERGACGRRHMVYGEGAAVK